MVIGILFAIAGTGHSSPQEVPFTIGEDAIIINVEVNGKPASLMFDTGFAGAVVLGDQLDIGKPTGTISLQDFVGAFQVKTVPIKTMKIGDRMVKVTGLEAVQQPSEHYSLAYGVHCDGILGLEPFKDGPFQINFEKKKIIFLDPSLDLTQTTPDNTRSFLAKLLPLGHNSMELSVQGPKGEKLVMALDTGNSGYATTHRDVLEREKFWPEGKKAAFMTQSVVASGPVDTFYVAMPDLKIFGIPVEKPVFSVIDLPSSAADHDGTIGFRFLRNFNLTIDLAHRRVLFENYTGTRNDEEPGAIGVLAFKDPRRKRMRIYSVMPDGPADKAGVKRGDDLLSVDGLDVDHMSYRAVRSLLEGKVGSEVKLDLSREGQLIRHEIERIQLVNDPTKK